MKYWLNFYGTLMPPRLAEFFMFLFISLVVIPGTDAEELAKQKELLPEYYGLYAISEGKLIELNDVRKEVFLMDPQLNYGWWPSVSIGAYPKVEMISPDASFAVFQRGLENAPIILFQYTFITNYIERNRLDQQKALSEFYKRERAVLPDSSTEAYLFVAMSVVADLKSKPVPGQTEMVVVKPRVPLQPGIYGLFVGKNVMGSQTPAVFAVGKASDTTKGKCFNLVNVWPTSRLDTSHQIIVEPCSAQHAVAESVIAENKKREEKLMEITKQSKQPVKEFIGKDGAPMVYVAAGEFATKGKNQRSIYLNAFWIDKYEVTVARYAKFLEATKQDEPKEWPGTCLFCSGPKYGDRPVTSVTYDDAAAYCVYAGKRLPTNAEWTKAARGVDARKYPWGEDEPTANFANYGRSAVSYDYPYGDVLAPVGSYQADLSPYGAYDMAGNVSEWVADWCCGWQDLRDGASESEKEPLRNPKGPSSGSKRTLRGADFNDKSPGLGLSTAEPKLQATGVGFRCAQDVKSE